MIGAWSGERLLGAGLQRLEQQEPRQDAVCPELAAKAFGPAFQLLRHRHFLAVRGGDKGRSEVCKQQLHVGLGDPAAEPGLRRQHLLERRVEVG